MPALSLALRFVLELCLLAALAIAGARLGGRGARARAGRRPAGAGGGDLGRWIAPKARRRLRDPARLALELVLFALAAGALIGAGLAAAGIALGVAYGVSLGLLLAFGQRGDA